MIPRPWRVVTAAAPPPEGAALVPPLRSRVPLDQAVTAANCSKIAFTQAWVSALPEKLKTWPEPGTTRGKLTVVRAALFSTVTPVVDEVSAGRLTDASAVQPLIVMNSDVAYAGNEIDARDVQPET